MSTIFIIEPPLLEPNGDEPKSFRFAQITLNRWAERQDGAAFISVDNRVIVTDYAFEHREVQLLRHLLNCNNLAYKCVTNVDLERVFISIFNNSINKTKRSKKNAG